VIPVPVTEWDPQLGVWSAADTALAQLHAH